MSLSWACLRWILGPRIALETAGARCRNGLSWQGHWPKRSGDFRHPCRSVNEPGLRARAALAHVVRTLRDDPGGLHHALVEPFLVFRQRVISIERAAIPVVTSVLLPPRCAAFRNSRASVVRGVSGARRSRIVRTSA